MTPPPPGTVLLLSIGGEPCEAVITARLPPDKATGIPWRVGISGLPGLHEWPIAWAALPDPPPESP